MSRPKNEDLGKPSRDRRVPVMMSQEEYEEVDKAARALGIGPSTYLRQKALEAARHE